MSVRLWLSLVMLFTGLARSRADVVLPARVTPVISYCMAYNDGGLLDGLGEASDWIELHNPTAVPVNLAGWKLQESANSWTFPSLPLPAGGYLIVFASGKLAQPYTDS